MATDVAGPSLPVDVLKIIPKSCAKCGASYPLAPEKLVGDAQRRIEELESQVRLLTEKATTAVDKLADYQDEIRRLKVDQGKQDGVASLQIQSDTNLAAPTSNASTLQDPATITPRTVGLSRWGSILSRKGSPAAASSTAITPAPSPSPAPSQPPDPPSSTRPPSVREAELQEALQRELEARQQAETKVTQMSGELEELSAQLFQQANEMVASERKARARLEERVEVLEGRDAEKRKRLERLERAVGRIERVHGLLKG